MLKYVYCDKIPIKIDQNESPKRILLICFYLEIIFEINEIEKNIVNPITY